MKHLLLVMAGLFSFILINAQQFRKTGETGVTTKINIDSEVNRLRKPNGTVLVHSKQGQLRLYATFTNNKVSGYYAIDQNGRRLDPVYTSGTKGLFCQVCINSGGTTQTCYEVDCTKIPPPIKKATANSTQ